MNWTAFSFTSVALLSTWLTRMSGVEQGVGQGHGGDPGYVGAVLSVAYGSDVALHIFVGFHDLALIHGQQLLNEGRSGPAAVCR